MAHFTKALESDSTHADHVVVRALVFGQDTLAEKWVQSAAKHAEGDMPWLDIGSKVYDALKDTTVGRLKAVGPGPEEGVVSLDDYATRTIKTLKLPGVASAIMLVFAGVGLNNALGDVHTSLAGTQTEAEVMLASAITGIMGAGFDLVRTGLAAVLERPSMVGPLAGMVNPAWLKFAKAGGAAGGAVAMIIAMMVDYRAVIEARSEHHGGLMMLHGAMGIIEGLVGAQLGIDLLAACGWEVGMVILSDPAMWVAAAAIIAVGTVITLVEDPQANAMGEILLFRCQARL
ncbi:MAG: hypothetical protein EPN68_01050 [Rhodanobacter sp.]|nr:MAG: hypothetical protein EPN68_01050 [Rhodanobacter sp.]